MQRLRRAFISGLVTLLPIALTVYLLIWFMLFLEGFLGSIIQNIVPTSIYIPGLGVLLSLVILVLFGLLVENFLATGFFQKLEDKLRQVPFIKVIYTPLRDLMNLFAREDSKEKKKSVVMVQMGPDRVETLGIVTRENFDDLPANLHPDEEERVAVYIPFSYGIGGFTYFFPRSQVRVVDIPIEKAMTLVITGWVKAD